MYELPGLVRTKGSYCTLASIILSHNNQLCLCKKYHNYRKKPLELSLKTIIMPIQIQLLKNHKFYHTQVTFNWPNCYLCTWLFTNIVQNPSPIYGYWITILNIWLEKSGANNTSFSAFWIIKKIIALFPFTWME